MVKLMMATVSRVAHGTEWADVAARESPTKSWTSRSAGGWTPAPGLSACEPSGRTIATG